MRPEDVAQAFRAASRAELQALKPGNVHVFRPGHGMTAATFERAAEAAALPLATGATVGARIEGATLASLAAVGCNANLGIVLLCAPLSEAALTRRDGESLTDALDRVLGGLTLVDAEAAYRAIASANPGGLGASARQDVRAAPTVTLRGAMAQAADRDRIAAQYVTGFADVLASAQAYAAKTPGPAAVEDVFLDLLARLPDSHVARKFGPEAAESLRDEAAAFLAALPAEPEARRAALDAFDLDLKTRGLNPGTTADLTVAAVFAASLLQGV
ncbi:triphosphoribosyl-dephospho-CoA synthase [Methylopila jiangsuensis]|uniref:Triphosphoribosyl-dephospho-CoA synthase n=1 Tax=Methylopila jiangsuensis TaxID=586230 RepID=A0A9W6N345_9HYPH|nr:triphosphoribosyl-dephospho-CoA synthase [Methylopila jiangsuensis]MDR6286195.1 triphosphoribosyl-dephospho-CoA synthase [Methylopila jiangsuensis]GLK75955.1 triphosphoribosyl-dephospho-CoA synthase [Methylopila jiangsuensis]